MYPHFFDWRKETAVPAKETPFYPCVAPARRGKLRLLVFYKNKTPKSLRCRSSPQKTTFFGDPIFPPYQGDSGTTGRIVIPNLHRRRSGSATVFILHRLLGCVCRMMISSTAVDNL